VIIERVASLLANAAPKGLLITRNELTGWLLGMNAYNEASRAFWVEAYGGRSYRVERQKSPLPIEVPHLAVTVFGGTQPDKLAEMLREADDGLLARFCCFWPDPVPFDLSRAVPGVDAAIEALDRLRLLDLTFASDPGDARRPLMVPLAEDARDLLRDFGREMQARQREAGGLMLSALGKARGTALRLSLVVEFLWRAGDPGVAAVSFTPLARKRLLRCPGAAARAMPGFVPPLPTALPGRPRIRRPRRAGGDLGKPPPKNGEAND